MGVTVSAVYEFTCELLIFSACLNVVETSDTYRTLSEENLKLQAEVMQYKVM